MDVARREYPSLNRGRACCCSSGQSQTTLLSYLEGRKVNSHLHIDQPCRPRPATTPAAHLPAALTRVWHKLDLAGHSSLRCPLHSQSAQRDVYSSPARVLSTLPAYAFPGTWEEEEEKKKKKGRGMNTITIVRRCWCHSIHPIPRRALTTSWAAAAGSAWCSEGSSPSITITSSVQSAP